MRDPVLTAQLAQRFRVEAPHPRLPDDGCRIERLRSVSPVALLETAVSLYDLSMGGCFVNSLHDQKEGTPLVLKIDLPYEGWITVKAETVYRRLGFGFAVRFVALDPETEACLERSIRAIQNRQPYDD